MCRLSHIWGIWGSILLWIKNSFLLRILHTFLFSSLWVTGCFFHYLNRHESMRRMMWGPWTLQWAQVHWQRVLLLTLRSAPQMRQMQRFVDCFQRICNFLLLLMVSVELHIAVIISVKWLLFVFKTRGNINSMICLSIALNNCSVTCCVPDKLLLPFSAE